MIREAPTLAIIIAIIILTGLVGGTYWYYLGAGGTTASTDPAAPVRSIGGRKLHVIPRHPARPAPAPQTPAAAPTPSAPPATPTAYLPASK